MSPSKKPSGKAAKKPVRPKPNIGPSTDKKSKTGGGTTHQPKPGITRPQGKPGITKPQGKPGTKRPGR